LVELRDALEAHGYSRPAEDGDLEEGDEGDDEAGEE
jgi:hypothetical protein